MRSHIGLELIITVRKDKPAGQVFGQPFSWNDALDAVADVYNGVSEKTTLLANVTDLLSLSSGVP